MTTLAAVLYAIECADSYWAGMLHGAMFTALFVAMICGVGIMARWAIRRN